MNELLKYFFPINIQEATPAASESYLHNLLAIVDVKYGATADVIVKCTSKAEAQALTDDAKVLSYFDGGGKILYVLPVDALADAPAAMAAGVKDYFSVLYGDGFTLSQISAVDMSAFAVCFFAAFASVDDAEDYTTAGSKKCGWWGDLRNLAYELGRFLNKSVWSDDQAAQLPFSGTAETSNAADAAFLSGVSFGFKDAFYGNVLAFFSIGHVAATAPYIIEEVKLRLQSRWLQYVSLNNPRNSLSAAKNAESDLQSNVLDQYLASGLLQTANIDVALTATGEFSRNAEIEINRPSAWWKMSGTIKVSA